MLLSQKLLEEIKNMRKEFQELKLLQLKLVEHMLPEVRPSKKEKALFRKINKMKFYSLDEVKRRLKV